MVVPKEHRWRLLLLLGAIAGLPVGWWAYKATGVQLTLEPGKSALSSAIVACGLAMHAACILGGVLAARRGSMGLIVMCGLAAWPACVLAFPAGFVVRMICMSLGIHG